MSRGQCIICGEEIPPHPVSGAAYCMHIKEIVVYPSQFENRETIYRGLWIHHQCWRSITSNIAENDASTNNGY